MLLLLILWQFSKIMLKVFVLFICCYFIWDCAYTQSKIYEVYINFSEWPMCTQTSANPIICLFSLFPIPFMLFAAFVPKIHKVTLSLNKPSRCLSSWHCTLLLLIPIIYVFTHMQRFRFRPAQADNLFFSLLSSSARFAPALIRDLLLSQFFVVIERMLPINSVMLTAESLLTRTGYCLCLLTFLLLNADT